VGLPSSLYWRLQKKKKKLKISDVLFHLELDPPFSSQSPIDSPHWDHSPLIIGRLTPPSNSDIQFPEISPSYLSRSPDARPPPPAQTEDYNKVKLRYMQKLNFDPNQLAQRALTPDKEKGQTNGHKVRESRASSFPVPIPASSPQTIGNKPPESVNQHAKKIRPATIQITAMVPIMKREERNDPASFVPPHMFNNEASFSVQRYHDRKRLARLAL